MSSKAGVRKSVSLPRLVVASALGSAVSLPSLGVPPLNKGSRPIARRKRRSKVASTGSFLPKDLVAFGSRLCMDGRADDWYEDGVVRSRLECILISRFRKARVSGMCRVRCESCGCVLSHRLGLLVNSVACHLYQPYDDPWSGNGLNCAAGSLHDRLGIGT